MGTTTLPNYIALFDDVFSGYLCKQLIDHFATKVTGLGVAKSFIHIDNLTAEQGFDMRPNAWKY